MTDLREAAKLALEALEIAKEYIEAELYERRSMYEPYQMEYKYSNEYRDLETNKKAIDSLKNALMAGEDKHD